MTAWAVVAATRGLFCILGAPLSAAGWYSNDFENLSDSLPEWSHPSTDVTPIGGRRFLGQFYDASDIVTLTLTDLLARASVTVSFDLFISNTHDGNDGVSGPDRIGSERPGRGDADSHDVLQLRSSRSHIPYE